MSIAAYGSYQSTGLDWLGDVPAHWRAVPFWALFRRTKRTGHPNAELLSVYRDYGVIRKADRDDNFNNPSEDLGAYQLVEPGDLVINKMKAWQGSLGISRYQGIVSPAYFVFDALHAELPTYLHYLLRSPPFSVGFMSISKGIRTNQWDLDPDRLSPLPVPLPSHSEQAAIVGFLDRETSKIDALVEEQGRLIELLTEKRRAIIAHAVAKGLYPSAPLTDTGVEWLGKVPAHWAVKRLKHLGEFHAGAGFPHDEQGVGGAELSFHKVNALAQADGDGYLVASENTVSRETADRLRAFVFPAGTIVFAKIGAALLLGRFRRLREPACLDNNMMGFVPTRALCADFVLYLMSLVNFDLIVNPGAVPSIGESQIAGVPVAVPPVEEQRSISAFLGGVTAKLDALARQAEAAIALLQERRSALISAAVTGKIDVRRIVAVGEEAA